MHNIRVVERWTIFALKLFESRMFEYEGVSFFTAR